METEPARFHTIRMGLDERKNNKYSKIRRYARTESSWVSSVHPNKLLCLQVDSM
jgi:hypothetical protein